MLLILYNLVLLPVLIPYLTWRLIVRGKSREGLAERFGRVPDLGTPPPTGRVWFHAVSLGEAVAATPVIAALRERVPDAEILVSTVTPTGQALVRRDLAMAKLHFYLPLDLPWVVRKVLARLRPSVIVLMEAEIWPNLLAAARRQGVPVVVANGHVSDRTLRRAERLRPFLAPVLVGISRYLAQSLAVAERAVALGVPADRVAITGHTKFDQTVPALPPAVVEGVRASLGLGPQQPLLLAGSTHEGEEELILDAWAAARRDIPDLALMIAPRHLERVDAIRAVMAERGLLVRTRSEMKSECRQVSHQQPSDRSGEGTSDVILLDSMGELAGFYALASIAFVGGSLVPKGGHDILQPLIHGVPVLFGPYMHNQRVLAELALHAGAARQITDADELGQVLVTLLTRAGEWSAMTEAGARLLAEHRGAAARCAAVVADLVRTQRSEPGRSSEQEAVPGYEPIEPRTQETRPLSRRESCRAVELDAFSCAEGSAQTEGAPYQP